MIRYFKPAWESLDTSVSARVSELEELLKTKFKRVLNKNFGTAFNVILTSIHVLGGFDGSLLAIPTNHNLYTGKDKRNPAYTIEMYDCLKWLIEKGYLVKESGMKVIPSKRKGETKYTPYIYSVNPDLFCGDIDRKSIRRNPLLGYVELRETVDGVKRAIPISLKEERKHKYLTIEPTNELLKAYDDLMQGTDVCIGTNSIHSAQTSLTRIFSRGSLDLGGRFYASIQNVKSEARRYIRMNGEPTVELDFSAIHPIMIYDLTSSAELVGDPYTMVGWNRTTVKVAFNIMLNRDGGASRSSASKTIAEETNLTMSEAKQLEQDILQKHNPIKDYFNSDSGLALQRVDSDVMFRILQYFVKIQRPIIPIHDSAVVSVRDVESLRLVMESAYAQVMRPLSRDSTLILKGIKADSLPFTSKLDELIEHSLNGTLENYDASYWNKVMKDNIALQCPDELYSTDINISTSSASQ